MPAPKQRSKKKRRPLGRSASNVDANSGLNAKAEQAVNVPAAPHSAASSSAASSSTATSGAFASRLVVSRRMRIILSLLVVCHLVAVVAPPLAFQANGRLGSSPSVDMLIRPVESYGQFLYLDRGYAFFAPDPGPSHLIQAAVTEPTGELTEIVFPDLERQWPRLEYHRHFMLAEFLTEIYQPPGPPPMLDQTDPLLAAEWSRLRLRYEHVRQSIVDHLRHEHDGKPVQILRLEHVIPDFLEFEQANLSLDDRQLYIRLTDTPITADGVPIAPEAIPAPVVNGTLDPPSSSSNSSSSSKPTSAEAKQTEAVESTVTPTVETPASEAPAPSAESSDDTSMVEEPGEVVGADDETTETMPKSDGDSSTAAADSSGPNSEPDAEPTTGAKQAASATEAATEAESTIDTQPASDNESVDDVESATKEPLDDAEPAS